MAANPFAAFTFALVAAALVNPCIAGTANAKTPSTFPYRLEVSAARLDAVYAKGEPVAFDVSLRKDGVPVASAEVKWTLSKDGVPLGRAGVATVREGTTAVTGTLDEPGFLTVVVEFVPPAEEGAGAKRLFSRCAAAVDPLSVAPSLPAPDDFDAFWASEKSKLAAVPLNVQLTPVASPVEDVECFDVQAGCVGDKPLSGYLARPRGARTKALPGIVLTHGSGVASSRLSVATNWAKDGFLALDFNVHGIPNGKPREFYKALAEGELKDYRQQGKISRDTMYYKLIFMRLLRAIDVVAEQPQWDGRRLVVSGRSQGGGQAIVSAGLDPRVTMYCAQIPTFCDHTGIVAGRINGSPRLLPNGENPPDPSVLQAARYYDAVNFAPRTSAKAFFTVGFIDQSCPPTGVYAAFNQVKGSKSILNLTRHGHVALPEADQAVRDAVLKYVCETKDNAG